MGNKILYAFLLVWVKVHAILPLSVLYLLSDIFYFLIYYLIRYRRKVVGKNLRNSFPDKTEKELNRLECRFYRHFSDYIIETIKLAHISQEELLKRANIRNPELVFELMDKGHTCFIMLLGHYGNWEWFSGVTARFDGRATIYQIYRPLTNKAFDRLFIYLRTRFHSFGIKKNEAVRDMIHLKRNKIHALVPFVADQTPSKANLHYWTNFLNQDSAVLTGPERIAKKLDIPVIFADVRKTKRGFYTVDFELITDNAENTPDTWITEQYIRKMERGILRDPAYWLWTHKRWKHKKPEKPSPNPSPREGSEVCSNQTLPLGGSRRGLVIILNWNGRALLEEFLPSVIANTPSHVAEIVVADNGSTDDSIAMLREKFPSVRILSFDKNYGFAEGYNKAIAQTDAPCIVLLNSDVEVTPGWLDAPLSLMETDKSIAAVQPKIRAQRNKKYFEYAGAAGGFIDIYGYPYCRGRILSVIEEDNGQYDTQTDLLWATGACLFIRTDVYKTAGGLDANFFAHQEEIDLCWRLRSRGYRIVYTPQSVVYHVGGGTLTKESPHKTFLNFRNNLLMLYKNLPEKELRHVFRIRFWLDRIAAAQFFITGHAGNAFAVFRARREFKQLKKEYASTRQANIQKTTCPNIPEIRKKSLLFSFYIQSKKKFSQL